MQIISVKQFFYKKITLVFLVLAGNQFSASAAIPKENVFEMVTALTTMALDIAHKHYQFKNNSNKTEVLGLLAAASSVTNKGLFLLNNHQAQRGLEPWDPISRDCIVNSAWGARDLLTFVENIAAISTRYKANNEVTEEIIAATPEGFTKSQDAVTPEKSPEEASLQSKLVYARDVVIFPFLKGLSSLAIACTQNYTTSYSGDRARFTATAAHSFIRLLEEYCNLSPNSKLSIPLMAAAIANFLWFTYETQEYANEKNLARGNTRQGVCPNCNEGPQALRVLGCNHATCNRCLHGNVQHHLQHREDQIHHIECTEAGCNHQLTRYEVQGIAKNNPQVMHGYDLAAFHDAPLVSLKLPARRPRPAPARPPRPPFAPIDPGARAAFEARRAAGNCAVCMDDVDNFQPLECGHGACLDCLRGHVTAHLGDGTIDQLGCPNGCDHHLTRNEIGCIVADDEQRRVLDLYDDTAYNRANPQVRPPDDGELEEIAAGRLQICPGCDVRVERDGGCNHMTCPCGVEYCWVCGTRYNPLINGGHGWGARACACPHFPGGRPEPIPVPMPAADPLAPPAPAWRVRLANGDVVELDFDPRFDPGFMPF